MKNKNHLREVSPLYQSDTVHSSAGAPKQMFSSSVSGTNHVGKLIWSLVSQERSGKSLLTIFMMCLFFIVTSIGARAADVNVLIVGSSGHNDAFQLGGVKDRLKNILDGAAAIDDVNVEYQDTGSDGLLAWYFKTADTNPRPELARWANLRGESGKDWDYVILLGEKIAMETVPAAYFEGVAHVATEVKKGGAEVVLLMPWPQFKTNDSKSTVDHYKEVVYRAGRSGGYKVVPAGLAWEATGSPSVWNNHPTADGAFIAAASIYSRIWGESASSSNYVYNNAVADTVHTSVQANIGIEQFTGPFITSRALAPFNRKSRRIHPGITRFGRSTEKQLRDAIDSLVSYNKCYKSGGDNFVAGRLARNATYHTDPTPRWYWDPSTQYGGAVAKVNSISNRIPFIGYYSNVPNYVQYRDNAFPILFAQLRKRVPFIPVSSGGHHNIYTEQALASFIYTMWTGRCPISLEPTLSKEEDDSRTEFENKPTAFETWDNRRIGYETAWRMMHGVTRVPGLRVQPSSALRHKVTHGEDEINTVTFLYPPKENVTVNVSTNLAGVTVSPASLVFTPENYDQPQTVTVSATSGLTDGDQFKVIYNTVSDDMVFAGLYDEWAYEIGRLWVVNFDLGEHGTRAGGGALVQKIIPGDRALPVFITADTGYRFLNWDKAFNNITGDLTVTARYELVDERENEFYGRNLIVNGGAEEPLEAPWTPGTKGDGAWRQQVGLAQTGNHFFRGSGLGDFDMYQDIDVTDYAAAIATGQQMFDFEGYLLGSQDNRYFNIKCYDQNGTQLYTRGSPISAGEKGVWELWAHSFTAPLGTTRIRITLELEQRGSGTFGEFDSMKLKAVELPQLAILNGETKFYTGRSVIDMGPTIQGSAKDLELTIVNTSSELDVNLDGNPLVNLTGDSAFTVIRQPAKTKLAPGETTTFMIRYTAHFGAHEQHTATLIIGNTSLVPVFVVNLKAENPGAITNLVLNPIHDGDIFESDPDATYGRDWQMAIKGTFSGNTTKGLMKFNLNNVVGRPYSSTLRLYKASGDIAPVPVSTRFVENDDWRENTLSWNNAPEAGDTLATVTMEALGWYEVDITPTVQNEFSGDKYLSLMLEDSEGTNRGLAIRSLQAGQDDFRPELVLSVPTARINNGAPTAYAGEDRTVLADSSGSVTLIGSGSVDSGRTITSYVWSEGGSQIATGSNAVVTLGLGEHTITLTVTDNTGATGTDTITLNVLEAVPVGYGGNLLINGGGELGDPLDIGWRDVKGEWQRRSGGYSGNFRIMGSGASGVDVEAYQNVDVREFADTIGTGQQSFSFTGYVANTNDRITISMLFLDASETVLANYPVPVIKETGFWDLISISDKLAPVGTTHIRIKLFSEAAGSNNASFDEMKLVANKIPAETYVEWANGGNFGDDANGDGVSNGLAYALGADDASVVATNLMPTAELGDDPAYYVFCYRRSDDAHVDPNTTICAEYSLDIDTWVVCEEVAGNDNIILTEVDDFYGTGVDKVVVKIKRSLANGKGIFCRLKVTQ